MKNFNRRNFLTGTLATVTTVSLAPTVAFAQMPATVTRQQLIDTTTEYLKNIRGIYDYIVVCDDTNNTSDIIDSNKMVVDYYYNTKKSTFVYHDSKTYNTYGKVIG